MPGMRRTATSLTLIIAAVLLSGAPAAVRAAGPEAPADVSAQVTLVDQITSATIAAGGMSSNVPNCNLGPRTTQAADDVVVTTAGTNIYWKVQQITVSGANTGAPAVDKVTIYVYNDNGSGLPGALRYVHEVANPPGAPNYVLATNFFLQGSPSGRKYWIAVQANVTSTNCSIWSWQSSSLGGGGSFESAWVEIGSIAVNNGTCSTLSTGWGKRFTECTVGMQLNLALKLDGQIVTLPLFIRLPEVGK